METVNAWLADAWVFWNGLGYEAHYKVWLGVGIAMLVVWLWLSYGVMRRLIGHKKINGTWINEMDFEAMLDRLCQKERDGASISLQDVSLLERYRPDRHDRLKRLGGQEFVSW